MPSLLITLTAETRQKFDKYFKKREQQLPSKLRDPLEVRLGTLNDQQQVPQPIALDELTAYLTPKKMAVCVGDSEKIALQKLALLQQSACGSLLEDIEQEVKEQLGVDINSSQDKKAKNRRKYLLLAIAGTIFFGCEGFDGITAILGIFSIPAICGIIAGTIFSIISIAVFHGFGLVQIAEHLAVELKDAPRMVEELLVEFQQVEAITESLFQTLAAPQPPDNLEQLAHLKMMLQKRLSRLAEEEKKLQVALERPRLKAAKTGVAIVSGIIFFSSGFFAGQAVAASIAGLFIAASLTFWPIAAAAVVVALASLAVYWFVERPGIENLIGRLLGLDQDKIEQFDAKKIAAAQNKLTQVDCWLKDKQTLLQNQLTEQTLQLELFQAKKAVAAAKKHAPLLEHELLQDKKNNAMLVTRSFLQQERAIDQAGTVAPLTPATMLRRSTSYSSGLSSARAANLRLFSLEPQVVVVAAGEQVEQALMDVGAMTKRTGLTS